jgi:hypothetical protein
MKNALHGGARKHPSTLRAGRANARAATVPAAQLQRALSELADVTQALTTSRQEAQGQERTCFH